MWYSQIRSSKQSLTGSGATWTSTATTHSALWQWRPHSVREKNGWNFDFIESYCRENIPQIKPNVPDATYLVWLDCRQMGMENEELRKFMIEKAGLGLNEGWSFGRSLSGYMRLNAACPRPVLERALKQLKKAVDDIAYCAVSFTFSRKAQIENQASHSAKCE